MRSLTVFTLLGTALAVWADCESVWKKAAEAYCDDCDCKIITLGCPLGTDPTCDANAIYRMIDGTCNNNRKPRSGSTNRALARILPPGYDDCISTFRKAVSGADLPSARRVSQNLYAANGVMSQVVTMMHMTYGNLLVYDLDLSAEDPQTVVNCGTNGCSTQDTECQPIFIDPDDSFFTQECLRFVRVDPLCQDDNIPRQQPNRLTAWLDAGFLYGKTQGEADSFRTLSDGLMKTSPHPGATVANGFRELLPQATGTTGCAGETPTEKCFVAGDPRANLQVGTIALHTVSVRYHNYIAQHLKANHGTWNDERLYQESKRIFTAVWQHTIFNEYLQITLGPDLMKWFDLKPKRRGYFKGYNKRANPDVTAEFSIAFRYGHSQIGDYLRFADPTYSVKEDVPMYQVLLNPSRIYDSQIVTGQGNEISGVNAAILGQIDQCADEADIAFTTFLTNNIFTASPPNGPGIDLPAFNTQRGRDYGLRGYNDYRGWCKALLERKDEDQKLLKKGKVCRFKNLRRSKGGNIDDVIVDQMESVYESVDDIDLYTGVVAEDKVHGGLVGATLGCIIAVQFRNLKKADRFFYERPGYFEKDQLDNIREQTFSSILCAAMEDEGDIVNKPDTTLQIQKYALLKDRDTAQAILGAQGPGTLPEFYSLTGLFHGANEQNQRELCADLPQLDFSLF